LPLLAALAAFALGARMLDRRERAAALAPR
jgi:hypothetical protein